MKTYFLPYDPETTLFKKKVFIINLLAFVKTQPKYLFTLLINGSLLEGFYVV